MRSVSRAELVAVAFLGAILFVSALALVELHYRARLLFVTHEHEVGISRRLLDDQAELQMKVRRAALPGVISSSAQAYGLEGATGAVTYTLVIDDAGGIAYAEETAARLVPETPAGETVGAAKSNDAAGGQGVKQKSAAGRSEGAR
ncbi:hypothetical protein H6A60_02285 [Sutterella massiliensis]|uniref:Cell division protein FtsL n=1 Tax=Sutterella massiliensis TaxID=1816689 RepID=A0ABS2DPS9_9BURK|nr:hypothetical protein [Sutterella massiliensis]MBM6703336.1 hypothetical protein [Sutterella massiliensis]